MRLLPAVAVIAPFLLTVEAKLTPPVLPLIVRNPYLSCWLLDARDVPWSKWPMFWTGESMGFGIMASVPDSKTVYPLLGRPHDSLLPQRHKDEFTVSYPIYMGSSYDASTTNLTYRIPAPPSLTEEEPLDIILSFLSPITPTSSFRQAIPASYLTAYVKGDFAIDLYLDLNGQWVSGNRGNEVEWEFDSSPLGDSGMGLKQWRFSRRTQQLLTEFRDQAEWGTLHFTAPSDVRHESGTSATLRQRFARTGTLQNTVDHRFRGIMDAEPVFAFAKSFHLNDTRTDSSRGHDSVTFTIALIQNPVVQFASARGLTLMRPLWASYFASARSLLEFHYLDFHNANRLASNYSAQLAVDAYKSGAEDYVDIVALGARQVIGATTFSGTPDDPILFLKEISSNGNFQTIDVIFPSFPFFLYTNPRWLAYLLEPLIEHMLSGQYPNKYAMHDLGSHFPNATGHPLGRDEYMPVEECGNILIMGLAIVNSLRYTANSTTNSPWSTLGRKDLPDIGPDTSVFPLTSFSQDEGMRYLDDSWGGHSKGEKQARKWVERSYVLWKQWTEYLVRYSLVPENQLSTDDFAGWLAKQTNLALKGIIGINAMSQLAEVVGNYADAKFYKNISDTYVAKWEEYGMSRDKTHAKLSYDWYGSWTTLYNLYADSLLCFHLKETEFKPTFPSSDEQKPIGRPSKKIGFVPRHIYKMQSRWYHFVRQKYGLPLDNRHLYTKNDWEFFAMAVASPSTRSEILKSVAKWVNETVTDRPLTDLHQTEGEGGFPGPNFFARPVVGGHFAFLTLERACNGNAMAGLGFLNHEKNGAMFGSLSVEDVLKLDTAPFEQRPMGGEEL